MTIDNPELELAFDFVQYTNRNLFLTGKAGTGKTTFLHRIKESVHKRMVVVAPTGVAAINAGGVTLHSFFQMPFGPIIPESAKGGHLSENSISNKKFNKKKIDIIKSMDLLVIDEISMVRADLLDGVDQVLRRYRDRNKVFGGVQFLMIGDLQQLAPIVKPDEWELLKPYYDTAFFFSSQAFQNSSSLGIELKHVYRQKDENFINILNQIRDNRLSEASLIELNKRFIPGHVSTKDDGYITLTTHNAKARRINDERLSRLKTKTHAFESEVRGIFPEYAYPADQSLSVKIGAQVMFVKNDSSQRKEYYNGKIGTVTDIDEGEIYVQCPDKKEPLVVGLESWENFTYSINEKTKEIEEEVVGTFVQYPLRLAWAITIHKSQGLTFEKAIIDAGASFAHGQTYVALSRCKTLEGIILSSRISSSGIISDRSVNHFHQTIEENPPTQKELDHSRLTYQFYLVNELLDFKTLLDLIRHSRNLLQRDASSIEGNLEETLSNIQYNTMDELIRISNAFDKQLQSLIVPGQDMESNPLIQERIKKACVYFAEQTAKNIVEPLDEATFASDNQAVTKSIQKSLVAIREELIVKGYCLAGCKNGFQVDACLETRAKAFFRKQTTQTAAKAKVKDLTSNNQELLNLLHSWREKCAEKESITISRVTPQ